MSINRTGYVDYQQRAAEFSVGDSVYPFMTGNHSLTGRVMAVWPAIGMVDVEWPHGSERVAVEDLQRYESKDFIPPEMGHDNIPGGGAVSVPGGPAAKEAGDRVWDVRARPPLRLPPEAVFVEKLGPNEKWVTKEKAYLVEPRTKKILNIVPMSHYSRSGSSRRVAEAFVKQSLYWGGRDRKYRATKAEIDSGRFCCPKCRAEDTHLRKVNYKRSEGRSEHLLGCPSCLFVIKKSDLIGHPDYGTPVMEVEVV